MVFLLENRPFSKEVINECISKPIKNFINVKKDDNDFEKGNKTDLNLDLSLSMCSNSNKLEEKKMIATPSLQSRFSPSVTLTNIRHTRGKSQSRSKKITNEKEAENEKFIQKANYIKELTGGKKKNTDSVMDRKKKFEKQKIIQIDEQTDNDLSDAEHINKDVVYIDSSFDNILEDDYNSDESKQKKPENQKEIEAILVKSLQAVPNVKKYRYDFLINRKSRGEGVSISKSISFLNKIDLENIIGEKVEIIPAIKQNKFTKLDYNNFEDKEKPNTAEIDIW